MNYFSNSLWGWLSYGLRKAKEYALMKRSLIIVAFLALLVPGALLAQDELTLARV